MKKSFLFFAVILSALFFALPLFAETYYWVGGGADNNWTTIENWRTGNESGAVATAYPTTGDTAFIAGDYTVTIDADIKVDALNIKKSGAAQYVGTDWTTKLTGSKKLTFGAMDFNRASSTGGVIGTLEIDCEAECTGILYTHSGTKLLIDGGNKLTTATLTHSATDKVPKSLIQVDGTLQAGTIDLQGGLNVGCNALKVTSGGAVTATNLTWSKAGENYTNGGNALDNAGTITLSGDLTVKGPVANTRPISVGGNAAAVLNATGDLGTISIGGDFENSGSGDLAITELQMTSATSITNSGAGNVTIATLSGNKTATLSNSSTGKVTVAAFASSPKIEVATDGISLGTEAGTETIGALTVNASSAATIAGALTVTGDISNAGTLATNAALTFASDFSNTGTFTPAAGTTVTATGASASFTGNGASLPNFVYAPDSTGGTGLKIEDENTFSNFSCAAANAKIAVNEANSFGTFSATGAGASITLSGANTIGTLTMTSGGGTLTANAAQRITGALTLKGASGSPLNITGTGSLDIESNQSAGEYLSVAHTGPAIGAGTYFYTAENSSFAAAPLYGQDKGWIFMDSPIKFVWVGGATGAESDWENPLNWNYNMVPGLTGGAGVPPTEGYNVTIPNTTNKPEVSGIRSYSIGDLAIEASASLTISGTGNVAVATTGKLTNNGTIVYSNTGRITDGTNFINDATVANGGTVEFTASGATDLSGTTEAAPVSYFNLTIAGSGDFNSNENLTVYNTLEVRSGNVYFNKSDKPGTSGGTETKAKAVTFLTGGTVSVGQNRNDRFYVTGTGETLVFPSGLDKLLFAGKITASGGITLSKDVATLVGSVDFNSKITLGANVNLKVNATHDIQTVTTNAELDCNGNTLTLTKACLTNKATVKNGKIVFEEENTVDDQAFYPYADSPYQNVEIEINKTHNGKLLIGKNNENGALTVTTLTVSAGNVYFNNSNADTATKATTATFATAGTVSFGNTDGDSFTVTSGGITHTDGPTSLRGTITTTDGSAINLGATSPNQETALAADTTIDARTGDVTVNGTLTGEHALTFKGSGTLEFKKTVAATKVTMTGAAPKIKANGATILDFEYAPTVTSDAGLTVDDENNTFTKFTCATAEAKVTLDKANNFGTLNMTSGGGTLTVNAAQKITGDLTLKGEDADHPLNVKGSGSLDIESNQNSGQYLLVTRGSVSIGGGTYYYSATDSKYASEPLYGHHKNWILLNKEMVFEWLGGTGGAETDWGKPTNWNYELVPGLASATGDVDTRGYPVKIATKPNPPATGAVSYSVGQLTINDADSNLTLSAASVSVVKIDGVSNTADGTLTNKGTIYYSGAGRITNGTAFINDASNGGTVNFNGTVNASDLSDAVDTRGVLPNGTYHNLKISGSGNFEANAALTVNNDLTQSAGTLTTNGETKVLNDLTVSGGAFHSNAKLAVTKALKVDSTASAFFNNSAAATATSAQSATFTTNGTISLGNTASETENDTFTTTDALSLSGQPAGGVLKLGGTISSDGGITLAHNAVLNDNTNFASDTKTSGNVTLSGSFTVTNAAAATLDTSAGVLTLENANLVNTGAVTGGNITFTETSARAQEFTPSNSLYTSVTINKDHTGTLGSLEIKSALKTTSFVVTKNGTLTADAAVTADNLTITQNTTATFKGLVTVGAAYSDATTAGNIHFNAGCSFTPATEFKTTGTVTLNGSTATTAPCAFDGGLKHTAGLTILYGSLKTSNKNIELGTTTLAADTTINAGTGTPPGTVKFGLLDGAYTLTSSGTGLVTFGGAIGGTTPPTQVTAAGSALFNAAANVNGPVTIAGDGQFMDVTKVADNIAITGNAVINGATTTTNSGKITVGANATINAATTSATTITVEGTTTVSGPSITTTGLQLYKGDMIFGTNCKVTGTVQAAANVATSGAHSVTFANDLWLYTSAAAALGGNGGSLSVAGNLYFAGESKNASVESNVTAKNVLLLHGTVDIGSAATLASSSGDIILLGADYDIDDDKYGAAASQVTGLFAYKHASRKRAASYTDPFPTACPDGTAISQPWSGAVTTNAGAKISAGQNFYANGLSSLGSGAWTLLLKDNNLQTSAFAEIYNSTISNCTASPIGGSGTVYLAAAEHNTTSGCSANIVTSRPVIAQAWTVYDDAIYISFKDSNGADIFVENSCNEISAACSSIFNSVGGYAATYIDADCQHSTDGAGDLNAFYIKSNNKWKTDASGITAGSAESSNRAGDNSCATIPYLNLPKALDAVYETLRDSSKNRIAHYYSASPDISAASAVAGKTFTAVVDKCAPVLTQVLTGQELHGSPGSQAPYDAHNFIEFVYSEPVDISGGVTSVLPSDTNIQAQNDLGATTSSGGEIVFAGLATTNGKIEAALKTGSGSPHALYRNFSTSAAAAARDQPCRIRVSIAGYTDGAFDAQNQNWPGYVSSAISPVGTITRMSNANIKDKAAAQNSQDINSTSGHALPPLIVQNSANELYGSWDVTPPSFAPVRINGTHRWVRPATDGSQEYEFVGASYGTGTLSAIELHWFDNEPSYTENLQWFSRVGWANASSPTEHSIVENYAADVRGGSRPDASGNTTAGGIRFCTLRDSNGAFKYSVEGTEAWHSFSQQILAGAESSLFAYAGDTSGLPTHTTGAEDGLYCKLRLDETNYVLQTTFALEFDSSICYITDLAGNRIQCGKIKMKTIDRTPPAFNMSAVPLGTKNMLIIFSKALNTDNMLIYSDAAHSQSVPALEYIPKSLVLTNSSGTGIQIDQNIPAQCLFKNANSTGLLITLNQNAVLTDVASGVFVTAQSSGTMYDPLAGVTASVTYIQDAVGNYVVDQSKHAFSDFAVNAVLPQYAYDNSITDDGSATGFGLYQDGSWAVRDWNAEQANYGTLHAGKEIMLQVSLYDGTDNKSGGLAPSGQLASGTVTGFFANKPTPASVSTKINETTGMSWRIWQPNWTSDIFPSLAPANNSANIYIDGTANDAGVLFDIPKDAVTANWKSGDQISFLFKMGNYTVDHFGNGTIEPLYAVRLKNPNDITSLDLWSFKIKETTLQRGGVSILNNVINVDYGENTVVQVDLKESGNLNVIVMTLDGNIVTYLRHGHTDAGTHYYKWNGTNNGGSKVARGLYFVRVIGPGIDETRKVMCVK